MLINSVRKIEGKWISGMIHGVPVPSHFRFPIILKSN